jgi:hypothetical protein
MQPLKLLICVLNLILAVTIASVASVFFTFMPSIRDVLPLAAGFAWLVCAVRLFKSRSWLPWIGSLSGAFALIVLSGVQLYCISDLIWRAQNGDRDVPHDPPCTGIPLMGMGLITGGCLLAFLAILVLPLLNRAAASATETPGVPPILPKQST